MAERPGTIDGYVADEAYPSTFQREFAPPWIDAMVRHKGYAPPRRGRSPFRLLDLGCGDGFGLIALAAAHPEGEFVGIDAMPEHIASGEAVARRLGLANIGFRCARFADVADPASGDFDYVTVQGVIAWVSEANRRHVFRIAASHLRPGGVAGLGYNAMPGWRDMIPFQRLLRALAEGLPGNAHQRFDAALDKVKAMILTGTPALPNWIIEWIDGKIEVLPKTYFAHEYLNQHWQPLWSADVFALAAGCALTHLGSSRPERLREDFCLTAAQRAELAGIGEAHVREIGADIFVRAAFRVDLFGKALEAAEDPQDARLGGWWAATVAEDEAEYSHATAAGKLKFDNAAAHAILAALDSSPATLRTVRERGGCGTAADVLNAADALFTAGHIVPADPPGEVPAAAAVNAEILAPLGGGAPIGCQVGRHGAMPVSRETLRLAASDEPADRAKGKRALARLGID